MKFVEKYWPLLVAILITVAIYFSERYITGIEKLVAELEKNSLTISSTLMGFFLTILTIISSITTRRMKFIKDAGLFEDLISYLKNAIQLNILVIIATFVIMFINPERLLPVAIKIINYVFILIVAWTFASSIRFSNIFVKLLADPAERDKPETPAK